MGRRVSPGNVVGVVALSQELLPEHSVHQKETYHDYEESSPESVSEHLEHLVVKQVQFLESAQVVDARL